MKSKSISAEIRTVDNQSALKILSWLWLTHIKELVQYTAILTEQAWSMKDLLYGQKVNFFLAGRTREIPSGQGGRPQLARSGSQSECRILFTLPVRGFYIIESFRFEEDYEYEIWLNFFASSQNVDFPESFILPFFSRKVSTVTLSERLHPLAIAKWSNFQYLITCFRHFDILAKTHSRVTTTTTFSRQNDVGSRTTAS